MAQIKSSSHPTAKFGQSYAVGGTIKKFADGNIVEAPTGLPAPTPPATPPVYSNKAIDAAVVGGASSVMPELTRRIKSSGEAIGNMFKSRETVAKEREEANKKWLTPGYYGEKQP